MITLDYLSVKAFYEENKDFLIGSRLQKIQQPTRREFVFTIRGLETKRLYVNIHPQLYHLCFVNDETYKLRDIQIPSKPPMFCMLLRKHLEGFRITKVNLPPYERIFEIYFESYNELNEKIQLCLAIELMGKYSNIVLYNCDTNIIIGCAHNVGSEKSRDRELAGTLSYVYPPKQNKSDILRYFGKLNYESLNEQFLGISLPFQNQLAKRGIPLDKIKDYLELKSPLSPSYNSDEFSIYSELIENPIICDSVSRMIDGYYSLKQEQFLIKSLKLKLKNIIYPQYKKSKNLSEKISNQLDKKENSSKYKKYADLIMANLYNNSDYTKQISVYDWETSENITIELDDKLSLKENSQKYYKMFSKSKNSIEKLKTILSESIKDTEYYDGILFNIINAMTVSELKEILSECEDIGLVKKNNIKKDKHEMVIQSVDINGFKVFIGKNNKQNDYIVSKLSAPNDLWFHTQNCTGSHILLKIDEGKTPDEDTIYQCCRLAKQYSSASESTKVGVIYTKRKYLRKPPKANLGYVTYKFEKEIMVGDE